MYVQFYKIFGEKCMPESFNNCKDNASPAIGISTINFKLAFSFLMQSEKQIIHALISKHT